MICIFKTGLCKYFLKLSYHNRNILAIIRIQYRKMQDTQVLIIQDANQSKQQAVIDQDNWSHSYENDFYSIFDNETDNTNISIIQDLNNELLNSKKNFFKVTITKNQVLKKQQNNLQLKPSSKSIKSSKGISLSLKEIPNYNNPNLVLKQGYLYKKTDGIFFKWNLRFMMLTPEKLYFFQDNKRQVVIGCVNLAVIPTIIQEAIDQDEPVIVLNFLGQCQNIIFKAQDKKKSIIQWKNYIQEVIKYQNTKGNKILLKTLAKPLYECKDTLTEQQFIQYAETGDILLFQTNHTGGKLQRFFTNSDADHVAMIVKLKEKNVMIFEANQIYGVSLYSWNKYVEHFDLYQRIIFRKLQTIRKKDTQQMLLNFVKRNVGRKYDISISKLLQKQSNFDWQQLNQIKNQNQTQDQRGYFCSQLIAKAYKSSGLIDTKKASSQYWPVNFTEKKQSLELCKNTTLGPQQHIILKKHQKQMLK